MEGVLGASALSQASSGLISPGCGIRRSSGPDWLVAQEPRLAEPQSLILSFLFAHSLSGSLASSILKEFP